MERLLDSDPLTGESVVFDFDPVTNKMTLTHRQESSIVDSILDANKRMANDVEKTRKGIKDDLVHYARIPNLVIMQWKAEKGVDLFNKGHRRKVFQLLNDPDFRYLKSTTMHHDR